ncbi:B3 domain-containing protein At2g33720-like [Pistacia vera]|uniref:B3 domain-containing protein At2g33720-like n=1 Tax=Pistacia vera TaxID=55513 RepID=UPI0012633BD1|nr:B3 domain-containing protein At2g33720-like [Pistacia vera]
METPPPPPPNSLMGAIYHAQKQENLSSTRGSSRKETDKKQTPKKQKIVSTAIHLMKRKNHISPQESEETSEISTEVTLSHQSNHKKPRTITYTFLSLTNNTQVSTQLKLFDDTWPTANIPVAKEYFEGVRKKREIANSKIAMMKYYNPEEEKEERLNSVSTKLKLYNDPWNIKKRLTQSDMGHLCRLLLQTSLMEKYVLPFFNRHQINEVQSKEGMRVMVWDQDTQSQHSLIMKKWSTSKSYIFIDGWAQKFISRRNLKTGDEIGLYWDPNNSIFDFHVIQRAA